MNYYRFLFVALIIGLISSTQQAMDHTKNNRVTLIATYCFNEKNELLLGKNHAQDAWSVPVGPYQISDQGMEKAAQSIVFQVTGLHNVDTKHLGFRKKRNVPQDLFIHTYLCKNIPSDVRFNSLNVSDGIDFSCCDSWQWFHKDNLPENTRLCTARTFENKN